MKRTLYHSGAGTRIAQNPIFFLMSSYAVQPSRMRQVNLMMTCSALENQSCTKSPFPRLKEIRASVLETFLQTPRPRILGAYDLEFDLI